MLKQSFPLALALLLITVTTVAADVDLTSVKCVVATRDAQASKSADYKKSKVYFCCTGCVGRFQKSPTKYASQANRQLVQTDQYKQTRCPIGGGEVDSAITLKVSDVVIAFCCEQCRDQVKAAEPKQQIEMVFAEKTFEKAFAPNR